MKLANTWGEFISTYPTHIHSWVHRYTPQRERQKERARQTDRRICGHVGVEGRNVAYAYTPVETFLHMDV